MSGQTSNLVHRLTMECPAKPSQQGVVRNYILALEPMKRSRSNLVSINEGEYQPTCVRMVKVLRVMTHYVFVNK